MACIIGLYKVYCVCTFVCFCVCGCVYPLWPRKWIHWPELHFRHTKTACTATQRLASCCLRDLTYDLMADGPSFPETMVTTIRHTAESKTARNNTNSEQQTFLSLCLCLSLFLSLSVPNVFPVCWAEGYWAPLWSKSLLFRPLTHQPTANQSTRALRAPLHLMFTLSLYLPAHLILTWDMFTCLTV